MSSEKDFVIENGVLTKYTGTGGDVVIPDGVTGIGAHAFSSCSSLTSITIPNGVTSIGNSAFSYCKSLTSIAIPDGVTSIGDSAFYECSSLTSIEIPDGVTSIHKSAFEKCCLKDVNISEATIKKIGIPKARSALITGNMVSSYLRNESVPSNEAMKKLIISSINLKAKWDGWAWDFAVDDDVPAMARLLDSSKKVTIEEIEELIDVCSESESTAVSAFLIDYLHKKFSPEQIQENADARIEKELGLRDKALADWRKEFRISFKQNAAVIGKYKGWEETVRVPAKVGPHSVVAVRDKVFSCRKVSTVYFSEGIKSLGQKMFYGSPNIKDVYIPASVTSMGNKCIKKTIRIHAPAGSYAETYAKENRIPFVAECAESCI